MKSINELRREGWGIKLSKRIEGNGIPVDIYKHNIFVGDLSFFNVKDFDFKKWKSGKEAETEAVEFALRAHREIFNSTAGLGKSN